MANINYPIGNDSEVEQNKIDILNKVDKITGKGLSTEDYTTAEKAKMANVPEDTTSQLAEIENVQLPLKAPKTDIGLLTGLLTTAKTSIVAAINELFNNKANKTQEAWITPTLINGATFDATNPFRYRKNQMGEVECKGKINILDGNAIMTFPPGYRTGATTFQHYPITKESSNTVVLCIVHSGTLYAPAAGLCDFSSLRFIAEG